MGFFKGTTRFLIFGINFVIFLVSVAVIVLFSMGLANHGIKNGGLANDGVLIVGLLVGIVSLFITFLGCCGAIKESPCMLFTFAGIVATLLLLEIIAGALIYGYRHTLTKKFEEKVNDAINDYYNEKNSTAQKLSRELIDAVQSQFHCCGLTGYGDWTNRGKLIPDTCCPSNSTEVNSWDKDLGAPPSPDDFENKDNCNVSYLSQTGCKTAVTDWIKSMSTAIGIGALINALVFVAAIAASIWVGWTHKKNRMAV